MATSMAGDDFGSCTFYVALAADNDEVGSASRREQLQEAIRAFGGKCEERFDEHSVTHVVALRDVRDIHSMESALVKALGRVRVVSSAWVDACVKARQLMNPTSARFLLVDHRHCLAGVVATISQVCLLLCAPALAHQQCAPMPAVCDLSRRVASGSDCGEEAAGAAHYAPRWPCALSTYFRLHARDLWETVRRQSPARFSHAERAYCAAMLGHEFDEEPFSRG